MRDFREADLTVAAMPALCLDLLPLAVSTFLGDYPQARVSLHARSSEQVIDWIIGHQCAFGLAAPPYDLRGVKCEAEISVPCVCVLPAGHPLADREFITPADLAEQNIVLLTNTILRHRLERVFDAAGVPLADRIETPLSIVACRMVELGLGVGIFEPFTARYCLDRSIIVRRFEPAVPFNFGVLSPHGRTRSAAAQELLAVLHRTLNALDLPCGIQVNASKLDD